MDRPFLEDAIVVESGGMHAVQERRAQRIEALPGDPAATSPVATAGNHRVFDIRRSGRAGPRPGDAERIEDQPPCVFENLGGDILLGKVDDALAESVRDAGRILLLHLGAHPLL